jgi:hypothetical protein
MPSHYQQAIRADLATSRHPAADPELIEDVMRGACGTLDWLDARRFRYEVHMAAEVLLMDLAEGRTIHHHWERRHDPV